MINLSFQQKLPAISLPPNVPQPISCLSPQISLQDIESGHLLPPPLRNSNNFISTSHIFPYTTLSMNNKRLDLEIIAKYKIIDCDKNFQSGLNLSTPATSSSPSTNITQKKKRGRPRKTDIFKTSKSELKQEKIVKIIKTSTKEQSIEPIKRKRGRPRLPPLEAREKSKYTKKNKNSRSTVSTPAPLTPPSTVESTPRSD